MPAEGATVTRSRQDRLLSLLMRDGGWLTAARLADALGVTPRSIRSYVTALNSRAGGVAVESGPQGYRIGPAAGALPAGNGDGDTPRDRLHTLVRDLLTADDGIDVHDAAARLHVSDATLEADLARVRNLIADPSLVLSRAGSRARLSGPESAQRRLLSVLVHDEMDAGPFDVVSLRRALGETVPRADRFDAFAEALRTALGEHGYYINELGISDVLAHIAIAVDRVAHGRPLEIAGASAGPAADDIAELLATLVWEQLGVALGAGDRQHLAMLLLTRVVTPGPAARPTAAPEMEETVRDLVTAVAEEFLVDLVHEEFIRRLALHVQNLQSRAREDAWSRNPLARSLKSSYPMIFDIAVSIASGLQRRLGFTIPDDEIAYIAIHVGGRLERSRRRASLLTATIVCPGYYEMQDLLRSSVAQSLGQSIEVVDLQTRIDPDWAAIDSDLILTTVSAPPLGDRVVRIQPFLTEADVDRVQLAASRIRRSRRLAGLRGELERYFDEAAFVSPLPADTEEEVIRRLGGLLVARGVIDDDYVTRAIERERLSSTAFTDDLAVPHAIGMTASRTMIAIGVADPSIRWGDARVHVVALVAFSEDDREAFQTVFEQLVEVFGERESVQRLLARKADFSSFLDELVAVIDG
ncbi:PTS sugar transporter subunit IIA [Microbacterium sp. KUDC0406]|uniref:BglG family transcription antiterminator n=1 Tax=Microbacterium sp. KUDC0406 TaxID=2909588 RepID=UPI001F390FF3|nr:PTS sugar transporter subunit IIA [Microbacterium sp. KUDC0406]UJP11705.1 PTS sugar transporter subunit IIA [Microbacterium sp. KUDC0406]